MDFPSMLASRNAQFARDGFSPELTIAPSQRTTIIGCVDPRVDPMDVLRLDPGEAVVVRNVGGRVTPGLLETLTILGAVARAAGSDMREGWNLVVLQHTDCGIKGCYRHAPALLAPYFGVAPEALDGLAINDPRAAVAIDIAALRAHPGLPEGLILTGMVYDVATGTIETVVPPARLRELTAQS